MLMTAHFRRSITNKLEKAILDSYFLDYPDKATFSQVMTMIKQGSPLLLSYSMYDNADPVQLIYLIEKLLIDVTRVTK